MTGYIYKIRNKINNKIYIGQTYYINRRFRDHKKNRYHNPHFKHAINYYGSDNFEYTILHKFIIDDKTMLKKILNHLETFWIFVFNSNNPDKGYNANLGGNGNTGRILSTESKIKMSKSAKNIHKGYKNGQAKCIAQYDLNNNFIKKWNCITDVENSLGISVTSICNNLKGWSKSAGGFKWKYC